MKEWIAISVCIVPAIAYESLRPGQPVSFVPTNNIEAYGASENCIGVVDPFLKASLEKGEAFRVFLYDEVLNGPT